MSGWDVIIENLPEVAGPTQKVLAFKEKLKWTLIILVLFFVMSLIPLYGLGQNALANFEYLAIILGASFGSIVSLGIGPIVTASIVLQLLNGSGLWKFDLTTPEGKKHFQGIQKVLAIFFIIFEGCIYVFMGGLAPDPALQGTSLYFILELFLIFQLFLGGIMIMFMDEVVSKWGFGSGISLFIAAGVSQQIFVRALNFLPSPTNPSIASGAIPALFQSLSMGDATTAMLMLSALIATVVVFVVSIYAQAMKVEIPLSFGRIRGHGIRWPLSFMYTSNIPVILVSALMANVQLWARLMQNWIGNGLPLPFIGGYDTAGNPVGLVAMLNGRALLQHAIQGSFTWSMVGEAVFYMAFMILGSVIFGIFWVQTSGMDARSQAKQIMASGLQVPGFRKDERVLERLLSRYIWPLTIMGSVAVGFLAALADLSGALSRGTGILLTVMIIYKLYEDIARQHMMDMNPLMKKFMQ